MPQITPFKGSNLTELALNRRNFDAQQQQLGIQNQQRDQALAQGQQRIRLTEQQIDQAAKAAGLRREEFVIETAREVMEESPDVDTGIQYLNSIMPTPMPPEIEARLRNVPEGLVGRKLKERQTKQQIEQQRLETERVKAENARTRQASDAERLQFEREEADRREQRFREEAPVRQAAADKSVANAQIQQDKAAESERKQVAADATRVEIANAAQELLNDDFGDIFGSFIGFADPLTSQSEVDLDAKRQRLVSLLTTGNLEKMSGVLSDTDIKILERAGSALGDRSISEKLAKEELERVRDVFSRNSGEPNPQGGSASIGRFTVKVK